MPETLQRRTCANHGDRPAFASCKSCRKPICQECATEWDGIQHCPRCLARRRGSAPGGGSWTGWAVLAAAITAAVALLPAVIAWTVAVLGSIRS
jgi:hypothetical protein